MCVSVCFLFLRVVGMPGIKYVVLCSLCLKACEAFPSPEVSGLPWHTPNTLLDSDCDLSLSRYEKPFLPSPKHH